jgi:hypothetical protein
VADTHPERSASRRGRPARFEGTGGRRAERGCLARGVNPDGTTWLAAAAGVVGLVTAGGWLLTKVLAQIAWVVGSCSDCPSGQLETTSCTVGARTSREQRRSEKQSGMSTSAGAAS